MAIAATPRGYIERPRPSGLADVVDVILDKGLVIDAYVRVALIGIEIVTIDARIVIASVDTYLRFAEACNRLDLESGRKAPAKLTDVVGEITEGGARGKTKGALSGVAESVADALKASAEEAEERHREPAVKRERPVRHRKD
jgi:gas vesicle structural protein